VKEKGAWEKHREKREGTVGIKKPSVASSKKKKRNLASTREKTKRRTPEGKKVVSFPRDSLGYKGGRDHSQGYKEVGSREGERRDDTEVDGLAWSS